MNGLIKCVVWSDVKPLWEQWAHFKKEDPKPLKIEDDGKVLMQMECIQGCVPRRTFGFYYESKLVGCAMVVEKFSRKGLKIAGLGKVAVNPLYRKNGICDHLMNACIAYMKNADFNISLLWASVLKVYEKHGYISLRKTNTMIKPITYIPSFANTEYIMNLHKELGTW